MIRVLTGGVLLAAVGSAIWLAPSTWLLGLAIVVAALGSLEYSRLCRDLGAPVRSLLVVVLTASALVAMAWPGVSVAPVLMSAVLVAAADSLLTGHPSSARVAAVAATGFAPLYLALPLGSLVSVHNGEGREAVLLLLLAVVASDTCQYYAGRTLGRCPLAPRISPKKTVEGAVGGVVGGTIVFVWLGGLWLPEFPLLLRVALGMAVALAGIVGDLFESLLKRSAEVKDSSHLIPGHGGVLDRIDALLFAAPVYFVAVRYGVTFAQ